MDMVPGLEGEMEMVVSSRHLSSATGNFGADVLSTHEVVLLMEHAAREAIKDRLPEGIITVGTRVDIQHVAAALIGSRVWAHARLEEVRGRRLLFKVEASDRFGLLAHGTNEQRMVSREVFLAHIHQRTGL